MTNDEAFEAGLQYALASFRELAGRECKPFELDYLQFKEIVAKRCAFCDRWPNVKVTSRHTRSTLCLIDLNGGYTAENILPACRSCYAIRSSMNDARLKIAGKIWSTFEKLRKKKLKNEPAKKENKK